jgi:hypothetical protein
MSTADNNPPPPATTSTQSSEPNSTDMRIEFYTEDNCEGPGEIMSATGVCNVFPKAYKSLRITNAPPHRCQIALFDRKYCDGGNPADGADTVLFIPLASLYEGESIEKSVLRSSSEFH